jgi:hypothetical protein
LPLLAHRNPKKAREPLEALPITLIGTQVQIISLPLGGRREPDHLPGDTLVALSGVKLCLSGLGSRAKVYETPAGIREVEHPLGFLTSKVDQDGEQHK